MSKKFYLLLAIAILFIAGVFVFNSGATGTQALWNVSRQGTWLLPLVIVSAMIDSINPCAFSILLLTIAFLFSIGKLRSKILTIGLIYILGIFAAYLAIGFGLIHVLHLFGTPHFMAKVGSALLILLGLINLVNHFFPRFPLKLRIPHAAHRKIALLMEQSSLPAAFALGALVGLCEFPCTGGPYLMVVGLLHDQATFAKGFWYLLLYNAIFVLPLVLILGIASQKNLLERVEQWRLTNSGRMRLWSGIIMVVLGIVIFFL